MVSRKYACMYLRNCIVPWSQCYRYSIISAREKFGPRQPLTCLGMALDQKLWPNLDDLQVLHHLPKSEFHHLLLWVDVPPFLSAHRSNWICLSHCKHACSCHSGSPPIRVTRSSFLRVSEKPVCLHIQQQENSVGIIKRDVVVGCLPDPLTKYSVLLT